MSSFYKLNIKEIKRETASSVSVLFNVPLEFKDFYKFTAGQYVNLKLTLDGEEIRRAYSLCSSPKSGELRIAVKSVKNGLFSKFANEKLAVGHTLEVGTPEGKFTFEPKEDRFGVIRFLLKFFVFLIENENKIEIIKIISKFLFLFSFSISEFVNLKLI